MTEQEIRTYADKENILLREPRFPGNSGQNSWES